MIKLSGLELGKDIEIEITGLRAVEKLYKVLLASSENILPISSSENSSCQGYILKI